MPQEIVMPRLSDTMEEGTIGRWLVKEGDSYSEGDVLAEIETDKATMEFQAYDAGTVLRILVGDGESAAGVCLTGRRNDSALYSDWNFDWTSWARERRNGGGNLQRLLQLSGDGEGAGRHVHDGIGSALSRRSSGASGDCRRLLDGPIHSH